MFCFIADWHALTMVAGPEELSLAERSRQVALDYLAAGLEPEKCAIFRQSDVKQHAELSLLLGMLTPVGWLERVPTYKENKAVLTAHENALGPSFGLMGYPVLQAADILIYRAHAVPVGKDQAAHLEITREIARRFNHLFGQEFFPEPQGIISDDTGVLMGTDGRKMSKSYNNAIYLSDTSSIVAKKIKKAYTSPNKIKQDDQGYPEGCSVCGYRKLYDPENYQTQWSECRSGARGCGQSKMETIEILNAALDPLRARRAEYEADPAELNRILARGAEKAASVAEETMKRVREIMQL